MIETLISLIVFLVVAGLIWWAVTSILAVLPVAEPFKTIVNVLLVLVLCLVLIYTLLPLLHVAVPHWR